MVRKNPSLINSSYTFSTNESTYPITYPISKIDAYALATGHARYIMDYELPRNGLYGALIIAKRACVIFKSIENYVLPGVVGILTADDIPNNRNYLSASLDEDAKDKNEELFVKVSRHDIQSKKYTACQCEIYLVDHDVLHSLVECKSLLLNISI